MSSSNEKLDAVKLEVKRVLKQLESSPSLTYLETMVVDTTKRDPESYVWFTNPSTVNDAKENVTHEPETTKKEAKDKAKVGLLGFHINCSADGRDKPAEYVLWRRGGGQSPIFLNVPIDQDHASTADGCFEGATYMLYEVERDFKQVTDVDRVRMAMFDAGEWTDGTFRFINLAGEIAKLDVPVHRAIVRSWFSRATFNDVPNHSVIVFDGRGRGTLESVAWLIIAVYTLSEPSFLDLTDWSSSLYMYDWLLQLGCAHDDLRHRTDQHVCSLVSEAAVASLSAFCTTHPHPPDSNIGKNIKSVLESVRPTTLTESLRLLLDRYPTPTVSVAELKASWVPSAATSETSASKIAIPPVPFESVTVAAATSVTAGTAIESERKIGTTDPNVKHSFYDSDAVRFEQMLTQLLPFIGDPSTKCVNVTSVTAAKAKPSASVDDPEPMDPDWEPVQPTSVKHA